MPVAVRLGDFTLFGVLAKFSSFALVNCTAVRKYIQIPDLPYRNSIPGLTSQTPSYPEDGPLVLYLYNSYPATSEDETFASSYPSSNSGYGNSPNLSIVSPAASVDPFRHEALRQPTVTVAISTEANRVLGSPKGFQNMASRYFEGAGSRLPIISQVRFFERLPTVVSNPQADFILLCLCMHLLSQAPSFPGQNMQSSLYVSVKSHISLLEATGFLSLDVVQARLLVTFYEMGHGIHPAGSTSIAACAQMARLLSLNKKQFQNIDDSYAAKIVSEEQKRVWWAVMNLDRYINLLNGDSLSHTEDPQANDHLPIEDTIWAQNMIPDTGPLNLGTPSNIFVGPFARECQISHLIGRVLRHAFEPSSDLEFNTQEALQLERTMIAFMPLLIEEQAKFQFYCAALGMCSRLWRKTGEIRHKSALDGLKLVLGYFNRRWVMAGKYLEVLDNIKEGFACAMKPIHGLGKTGDKQERNQPSVRKDENHMKQTQELDSRPKLTST
ncbi:hypothetical protein EG329_012752 [Mollisiaceae sp. DMI_Dod_QoI]|nr:hypothetical protein EG329_012752 [Helotiales sp. DMI_Dod_QoI]